MVKTMTTAKSHKTHFISYLEVYRTKILWGYVLTGMVFIFRGVNPDE